jgi:hypothetical protein
MVMGLAVYNIVVFLPIIQCVWVCAELYEVSLFTSHFLLNIMIRSSPTFSKKESTTVLNKPALQMRPNSFSCGELGQTHNHGWSSAINHGSHHLAIIDLSSFNFYSIVTILT